MASAFMTQLQPWEENQSPSPKDEIANPYELGLSRSRSSGLSRSPPSPIASVNLARQLSGEVNASPPPWTRRPSMSNNKPARSPSTVSKRSQQVDHSQSPVSVPPVPTTLQTSPPPPPPPAAVQPASLSPQQLAPPPSRRHPGLAMTPSMSDSPSGSSASLNVDDLGLPNPAFRRRPGSNRSSMSQSSLTSEELWALESQSNGPADLSNPMRQSSERPLDTIRRMSRYMDRQYTTAMPGDVIWPSAPPIEEVYTPPIKSKSSTSIVSLGNSKRGTRRRASRQASQTNTPGFEGPKSTPASPADYVSHSARSSSTSLASQNVKAHSAFMKTPPVSYYSRDYMSSLAPREGGYAVAAQLASAMSSPTDEVTRQPISRASSRHAPLAPSSGMGRWSLDGGENFGRPYAMASAATTSTSFSGSQPISPEDSPPSDIHTSPPPLPTGAAAPATSTSPTPIDTSPTIVAQSNTVPVHPSPLKVSTASPEPADASTDTTPTTTANPTPTATKPSGGGFLGAIGFRKSMKNLNKASSKDDKALAAKVNQQRAQAASEASAKKAAEGKAAAERKAAAESKAAEESKAAAERKAAAEAAARDAAKKKKEEEDREAERKRVAAAREEARRKELAEQELKKKEMAAKEEAKRKEESALAETKRKEQAAREAALEKEAAAKRKEAAEKEAQRKKEAAEKEVQRKKEAAEKEIQRKKEAAEKEAQKRKEAAEKEAQRKKEAAEKQVQRNREIAEKEAAKRKDKEQKKSDGRSSSFFKLRAPASLGRSSRSPSLEPVQATPAQAPIAAPPAPTSAGSGSQPFPKLVQQSATVSSDAAPNPPRKPATSLPLNMLTKTASQPPQAPPAPQRTMSQRATSGPPPTSLNKHRTSMFGTIKKRFSILTSSDSKTPTTPAKDAAPATPSKSAQPVVVDQAAVKALPAVPPSPVPVTVIEASPAAPGRTDVSEFGATAEPLRELPARTTSHTPPRPAVATFSPADAPPLMATPPGITRSTPQSAIPTSSSPQLTQTLSRDSGARSMAGSVGSINRRSSVKGPRPMPSSPESKGGVSIPNSDPIPSRSRLSNPLPVPSLPAGASPPQLQSFPLGPMVHARSSSQSNGSSNNPFPEIVTPSTPGEQSEYSVGHTHTTTTGTSVRLVSPSATPEEDRALFLSSSDNVVPPHVEDGHKVPTRESSGESLQPSVPA